MAANAALAVQVNSVFYPSAVDRSSTGVTGLPGWG